MQDLQGIYITKIHVANLKKARHLGEFDIELSETGRRHLILTGKNGSGKTSVLEAIRDFVFYRQRKSGQHPQDQDAANQADWGNPVLEPGIPHENQINVSCSENTGELSQAICAWFGNSGIDKPEWQSGGCPFETGLAEEGFDRLELAIRDICDCPEIQLKPNMQSPGFTVLMPGREPFGLHEMPAGHKALAEIFIRLERVLCFGEGDGTRCRSAIAVIDDIETHMHVELQKRAMPLLTQMFPSVQFVVSTHSPFVMTSIPNAVVFDLDRLEALDNPSFYSYGAVVESFLDADMYSAQMKQRLERYRELSFRQRTPQEAEEFLRTKTELELLLPASKELRLAFLAIEQSRKEAGNGPYGT